MRWLWLYLESTYCCLCNMLLPDFLVELHAFVCICGQLISFYFQQILCIHLKRFRHEMYFSSKISNFITFPLVGLDMRPFLLRGKCLLFIIMLMIPSEFIHIVMVPVAACTKRFCKLILPWETAITANCVSNHLTIDLGPRKSSVQVLIPWSVIVPQQHYIKNSQTFFEHSSWGGLSFYNFTPSLKLPYWIIWVIESYSNNYYMTIGHIERTGASMSSGNRPELDQWLGPPCESL